MAEVGDSSPISRAMAQRIAAEGEQAEKNTKEAKRGDNTAQKDESVDDTSKTRDTSNKNARAMNALDVLREELRRRAGRGSEGSLPEDTFSDLKNLSTDSDLKNLSTEDLEAILHRVSTSGGSFKKTVGLYRDLLAARNGKAADALLLDFARSRDTEINSFLQKTGVRGKTARKLALVKTPLQNKLSHIIPQSAFGTEGNTHSDTSHTAGLGGSKQLWKNFWSFLSTVDMGAAQTEYAQRLAAATHLAADTVQQRNNKKGSELDREDHLELTPGEIDRLNELGVPYYDFMGQHQRRNGGHQDQNPSDEPEENNTPVQGKGRAKTRSHGSRGRTRVLFVKNEKNPDGTRGNGKDDRNNAPAGPREGHASPKSKSHGKTQYSGKTNAPSADNNKNPDGAAHEGYNNDSSRSHYSMFFGSNKDGITGLEAYGEDFTESPTLAAAYAFNAIGIDLDDALFVENERLATIQREFSNVIAVLSQMGVAKPTTGSDGKTVYDLTEVNVVLVGPDGQSTTVTLWQALKDLGIVDSDSTDTGKTVTPTQYDTYVKAIQSKSTNYGAISQNETLFIQLLTNKRTYVYEAASAFGKLYSTVNSGIVSKIG